MTKEQIENYIRDEIETIVCCYSCYKSNALVSCVLKKWIISTTTYNSKEECGIAEIHVLLKDGKIYRERFEYVGKYLIEKEDQLFDNPILYVQFLDKGMLRKEDILKKLIPSYISLFLV